MVNQRVLPGKRGLISAVVPVYNETEVLPELHRQVSAVLSALDYDYEIVLVDDGSSDGSADMIRQLAADDDHVVGVKLSRNFGHESAINAGLHSAAGDAVIVMDADLQDSPDALPRLIAEWEKGAGVVYAVRKDRKEGVLQRAAFSSFYRLAEKIVDVTLPRDAGPFCLMSRAVVDQINGMTEHNRYFPGLRAFVGFTQVPVEVERNARLAGETKYSFRQRTTGALNAVLGFSKLPLRIVTVIGAIVGAISLLGILWVVISSAMTDTGTPGWVSLMTVVLFFSGLQLVTLGIVGEYVGKVYDEVRARPRFIISERWERDDAAPDTAPEEGESQP